MEKLWVTKYRLKQITKPKVLEMYIVFFVREFDS